MKRCAIGASSLCTTVVWNVWSWTTSLDVHCSGPHKRRLSSQQFKKLCACVSCLSSNCSFRVLAVRFHLIASLRRVSHWSAQDPFYFFRWFLFFKCLGRRFCQQSPRPCRNVRFPRFARGGAAVIAHFVPKATRLSQDPHAKMAVEAVAAVHACSWRRMMVSSRDPSCRTSLLRKPLELDAAMFGSTSAGCSPLASQSRVDGFGAHGGGISARKRGLRVSDWRLSGSLQRSISILPEEMTKFLLSCRRVWTHNMKDVIGTLSTKVGSTASVYVRAELREASNDDECGLVVFCRGWTTSPTHRRAQ